MKKLILGTVLGLVGLCTAAPIPDLVKELDQMPDVGKAFQMYSGFLPINATTKRYHYIAVTSEAPTNDLIFWFNGGPGCSSLFGLTMEIGPYIMGPEDTRFQRNIHAWNKEANVVYIEMPAGVGYSVCDEFRNPENPISDCYGLRNRLPPLNDDVVAGETLTAIINFF